MNQARDDFLADTALAGQKDLGVRTSGVVDFAFELTGDLGCSDESFDRHECASLRESCAFLRPDASLRKHSRFQNRNPKTRSPRPGCFSDVVRSLT